MLVTESGQLKRLVDTYLDHDAFVIDLETMYTYSPEEIEQEEEIRAISPAYRTEEQNAWLDVFKMKATDPALNEIIWIGLATDGRSDAVATGHPHGEMLKPQRREKVFARDVYGLDDPRSLTKRGAVSDRKVLRTLPAEFTPPPPQIEIIDALDIMRPLLFSESITIANQNLGFDLRTIDKYFPGEPFPPGPYFELQVAMQIINENAHRSWDLEEFVKRYLGHSYDKLAAKGVHNFGFSVAARYAEQDARFTWLLRNRAMRLLHTHGLMHLFEFEMELWPTLREQETVGLPVDRKRLRVLKERYETKLADIRDEMVVDYGVPEDFNLNSTPQKRTLLFKTHKVVPTKRTASGQPSTDASVLEKIAGGVFQYKTKRQVGEDTTVVDGSSDMPIAQIAQLLINHAEVSKLYGTYIIGMGSLLDHEDRLHPSFTQHATDTGRLSCRYPNVHNIPRESDLRNLFIAPPGYKLVYVDYDQIELRFISFLAREKVMRDVFRDGADIHLKTAMLTTGKDAADISGEQRTTHGKIPNFLISYGGTEYRLAIATGLPIDVCAEIIEAYFAGYPALRPWKERVIRQALEYAEYGTVNGVRKLITPPTCFTLMGRHRRLPDLLINPATARNKDEWKKLNGMRNAAERVAVNFEVQGSAAEALKTAMIDINDYVKSTKFPLQMVMSVHDEVVALVPDRHAEEALDIMERLMSSVVNRRTGKPFLEDWVALTANGKIADRWSKG